MHDNEESIVHFLRARMRRFLLEATDDPWLVKGWMREYDNMKKEDDRKEADKAQRLLDRKAKLASRQGRTPVRKGQLPMGKG